MRKFTASHTSVVDPTMAGPHECGICSNIYDESDWKPRVLQCGHTYCQQCLLCIGSQSSPACPSCRRDIVSPVAELPVNFLAIPASGSGSTASKVAKKQLLCSTHQNELDFWCTKCKVAVCKKCVVDTHTGHKLVLIEEIFYHEQILADVRRRIMIDIEQTAYYLDAFQQLDLFLIQIDEIRSSFPSLKEYLEQRKLSLLDCSNVMENISARSSREHKTVLLNTLRTQDKKLNEVKRGLKFSHYFASQFLERRFSGEIEDGDDGAYMPDGRTWIITGEAADKALLTMKQTNHTTPKAIVRSNDESPILCLFELLQYLATSSETMELEIMDTVERECPDEKEWFPMTKGGDKSTDEWHCYRLRALARAWTGLPAAAPVSDAGPAKVVALVNCKACTCDVGMLSSGEVWKRYDGSWPLPLEFHLVSCQSNRQPWLRRCLPFLYSLAEPSLGECRVHVPGDIGWYGVEDLFPMFAMLGTKYSTSHRLYLDNSMRGKRAIRGNTYDELCRHMSNEHKVAYEWKAF